MSQGRAFLVLWQTAEAKSWMGTAPTTSVGTHMGGLVEGDRIFISSCDGTELYLLGAMKVSSLRIEGRGPNRGKPCADGKSIAGSFQMLPLGGLKWRLRFENTDSSKLLKSKSLLWQVRSRRRLTPHSAELLLRTLSAQQRLQRRLMREFAIEGRRLMATVTIRERDARVRAAALKDSDFKCAICDLRPDEFYGRFAKECLDIHHLRPLSLDFMKRSATTLRDVVVVCPTCHRALHMFEDPGNWERFKQECGHARSTRSGKRPSTEG